MNVKEHKITDIIIYLAGCALKGSVPEKQIIENMDFEQLYEKALRHSMTIIIYMALENGGFISEDYMSSLLVKKWKALKQKAMQKILLLETERSRIQWHLEQMGIWYMPLKGSVLKNIYPKLGMREMTDVDILFDKEYSKTVNKFMVKRGYEVKEYGITNHDTYIKDSFYCFEFHKELFKGLGRDLWNDYYKNIKVKLQKDQDNDYGYHFSEEDFYIYMIMHEYKHYNYSGIGIRSLMDRYVYLQNKGEQLDWNYIYKELETLGVAEYEECGKVLANKIFSDPELFLTIELTEEEQNMLGYMQESGIHGTRKNWAKKELVQIQQNDENITGKTKLKYYMNKVFMNMEWYKLYKPFLYKHRWAIPFFVVYRFIRAVLFRRDTIKVIVDAVEKASEKDNKN